MSGYSDANTGINSLKVEFVFFSSFIVFALLFHFYSCCPVYRTLTLKGLTYKNLRTIHVTL